MSAQVRTKMALMAAIGLVAFATATYADTVRGQTGDQIPLPAVSEFRDGDIWDAYDAAAAQQLAERVQAGPLKFASAVASVSVERQAGHWIEHHETVDDWAREGTPAYRHFSDLRLKPSFQLPVNATEGTFMASPDGLLHRFVGGQWVDVAIGQSVPKPHGAGMLLNERITPHEAEAITEYFHEPEPPAPVPPPHPKPQSSDSSAFVTALCLGATAFLTTFFVRRQKRSGARTGANTNIGRLR